MLALTAKDIGGVIRSARRERGLTQAGLAERVGVTRAWVGAVERGKGSVELVLVLRTLAVLGLSLDVVDTPVLHGGIDLDELLGRSS